MESLTAASHSVLEYLLGPNFADPRTADWLLVEWKIPLAITILYLVGIPTGILMMKNRPPMKLKVFAAVHNAFLLGLSAYMTIETLRQAYANFNWDKKFSLWCNPVDEGETFSPSGRKLAAVLWVHYVSKAYEFVDTIIMVLKKNNQQISFLHVYHHATTFFPVWWGNVKYGPGGEAYFCCAYNSFVHVLMYGYYFAANFGFRLGAFKPFITMMQMIQFLIYISQAVYLLFITDCYRPRLSPAFLLFQCTIFFVLFTNFYIQTYIKKQNKKAVKKE